MDGAAAAAVDAAAEGAWIAVPGEPRQMKKADGAKGEKGVWKLYPEGLDNDGDTLVDCFDPGCQSFAFCAEDTYELCHDVEDNDGDGATDCADTDCAPVCGEASDEECHDGNDNDQDSAADCAVGAHSANCVRCAAVIGARDSQH